jgi:NTP pyrophosphatase (non-canonical NTP hydrolase)
MDSWQQRAAQFAQNHNLYHPPSVYALDLMSELGEVTKGILLATDDGERPFHPRANLQSELGDTLYTLCQLAASAGIDREDVFSATLAKYEERWHNTVHRGRPEVASPKLKNLE